GIFTAFSFYRIPSNAPSYVKSIFLRRTTPWSLRYDKLRWEFADENSWQGRCRESVASVLRFAQDDNVFDG
ncbi:MAG TPA: hypothetical protein VH088_03055, partial [Terriglobales bacterium]|nr:hypothetical protein [Terriglobales bacterium]